MQPNTWLIIILGILSLDFILDSVLSYINKPEEDKPIPPLLSDVLDKEKYKKSVSYTKARTKLGFISSTYSFVITITAIATGLLGVYYDYLFNEIGREILTGIIFLASLTIALDVLTLPFQIYSTFVIEEKFGFNRTTPKLFIQDKFKGYLLGAIIAFPLFYLLFYLILTFGQDFWVYFWVVITLFMIFMNVFYTSLIVPLFNKLTPLENEELREKLENFSDKVGFPIKNIFVIDGSKRSSKSNAYFSGLGPRKKIVLFDTLLENQTNDEIVAVLAHEIGHYKKKHIYLTLLISVLQTGLILYLMSLMVFNPALSSALGASSLYIPLNLIAFGILLSPLQRITGIAMMALSRKNEYEADAFAAKNYDPTPLQSALKKLTVENLSNIYPHPAYVFVNYSHPPVLKRLKALESFK